MKIPPSPPVGSLICYEYVWLSQSGDEGRKVYPCVVIACIGPTKGSQAPIAYVLGVSHSEPRAGQLAVEFPAKLKRHLKMDAEPAWVYLSEVNVFEWVGPDVRPANHHTTLPGAENTCEIGELPVDWFDDLHRQFMLACRNRNVRARKRSNVRTVAQTTSARPKKS